MIRTIKKEGFEKVHGKFRGRVLLKGEKCSFAEKKETGGARGWRESKGGFGGGGNEMTRGCLVHHRVVEKRGDLVSRKKLKGTRSIIHST